MDGSNIDKKYESLKIPERQQVQGGEVQVLSGKDKPISANERLYYEIEYGSHPVEGVGKYVLKSQKIEPPEKDEIRELFYRMRDISRTHTDNLNIFDRRARVDNAKIFYEQGMFMKDFSDNYKGDTPFSQYFPTYQMMLYEQLRTYFTWRTEVRKGSITDIPLSYAFLYIYELINNIGVDNPQDGLDALMLFWQRFRIHNNTVDKYVLRWFKDYHIYYPLPQSFKEFVEKNNLTAHYPKMPDTDNDFDFFYAISKYDIKKSDFFAAGNAKLTEDCVCFVLGKVRQTLKSTGINFDDAVIQPAKKATTWTPFKDAHFYQCAEQPDRRVILSSKEVYICHNNRWTFSAALTADSGKRLVGYIMRQTECVLRQFTKYKYKLTANISTVTHELIIKLNKKGLSLEKIINDAVTEFYREATKTVVKVDREALSKIREEAFSTLEKLIIPEEDQTLITEPPKPFLTISQDMPPPAQKQSLSDAWQNLKIILSENEKEALKLIIFEENGIKAIAAKCGIMPEVLADGINQKAMDYIGDNLLDEEFVLYDDYRKHVEEVIE